ncbi:uncharacterized protein L969DRAFT_60942 [Mixia osmundae IAM 14324]|uniref:C3H1-type domain-containing protein n=1 Tax=Mixia osmundae (strain CBS 9802 / IAM 14324 / JCM 22182 / KY 12970) TaxID=764103 RepID=G7E9X8_MIXOS|nr:uncharacterized protein L969DRAFT_60942 [Mixia osmundae IAM 14324]KEI40081.1 hypothetical protein L969DRAFT_60942 [Mixia osmundae IAM 14324]GAA99447.1 hypothetical protein E5Q_06146 [Mixia osmundae IAM 14324]
MTHARMASDEWPRLGTGVSQDGSRHGNGGHAVHPSAASGLAGSSRHFAQQSSTHSSSKSGSASGAHAKKASKNADLTHVPCRFYRAGACSAGDKCSFSHSLVESGTKPICQYYIKGDTCKFGHKCANLHIKPGEPVTMDKKNKQAARQSNALTSSTAPAQQHQNGTANGKSNAARRNTGPATLALADPLAILSPAGPSYSNAHRRDGSGLSMLLAGAPNNPNDYALPSGTPSAAPQVDQRLPHNDLRSMSVQPDQLKLQHGTSAHHNDGLASPPPPVFGTSPFAPPGQSSVFLSASFDSDDSNRSPPPGTSATVWSPRRQAQTVGCASREGSPMLQRAVMPTAIHASTESPLAEFRPGSMPPPSAALSKSWGESGPLRLTSAVQRLAGAGESSSLGASSPPGTWPKRIAASNSEGMISTSRSPPQEPALYLSPTTRAHSRLLHPPGTSLPQGLAAGLSRLHFTQAMHTGDTPVPSTNGSPSAQGTMSPSWGFAPSSPAGQTNVHLPGNANLTQRRISGGASAFSPLTQLMSSSPLVQSVTPREGVQGEMDEAPFAMDEVGSP